MSALKDVLDRLFSVDANERVKAANEIGEIGTPENAPIVLKVVMEDEASTVRQMAIQSYFEILGSQAIDELMNVAKKHNDIYVRIYAISCLGKMKSQEVSSFLKELLEDNNEKIRIATTRAIIQSNSVKLISNLVARLNEENNEMIIRNILEAIAIWKYKKAKSETISKWETIKNKVSSELQTMFWFTLSVLGDQEALNKIQNEEIDEFLRIRYKDNVYRGREKLLELNKILR